VAAAVHDALERGAVGFDAIKHLVLCRIERRPPSNMTVFHPCQGHGRDDIARASWTFWWERHHDRHAQSFSLTTSKR
jgi:hypothetical protein